MSDLSAKETAFFESVDIDPALVGPVIGRGMENLVRAYNETEVIKIPRLLGGWSAAAWWREHGAPRQYDKAKREVDLCEKYFGNYLVPTRIQADTRREAFCLIQENVAPAQKLNKTLCQKPDVHSQAQEIVEANARLRSDEAMYLDLMGFNPRKLPAFFLLGRGYMENVLITEKDDQAHIVDTGLLPIAGSISPYKRIQSIVQHRNIRLLGLTAPKAS